MFASDVRQLMRGFQWVAALLGCLIAPAHALQLSDARLWPSPDYTRLTLEAPQPIAYKYFMLANPERLVLDMEGVELSAALSQLTSKLASNDPYVAAVRIGVNRPGVMRLVLTLKTPIKPSLFQIKPLGEYGHRLVVDLYPVQAPDALAQLGLGKKPEQVAVVEPPSPKFNAEDPTAVPNPPAPEPALVNPTQINKPPATGKRAPTQIIIAIDAGHGGEDPGARGATGLLEKHVTLAIAKRVKNKLDQEPNMRGVLVREGDYFVPLAGRVNKLGL